MSPQTNNHRNFLTLFYIAILTTNNPTAALVFSWETDTLSSSFGEWLSVILVFVMCEETLFCHKETKQNGKTTASTNGNK
jgi:hypothetical protein